MPTKLGFYLQGQGHSVDLRNQSSIPISVCGLREERMFKSVYVRVFHDLELLREYVLRCPIERQL